MNTQETKEITCWITLNTFFPANIPSVYRKLKYGTFFSTSTSIHTLALTHIICPVVFSISKQI